MKLTPDQILNSLIELDPNILAILMKFAIEDEFDIDLIEGVRPVTLEEEEEEGMFLEVIGVKRVKNDILNPKFYISEYLLPNLFSTEVCTRIGETQKGEFKFPVS